MHQSTTVAVKETSLSKIFPPLALYYSVQTFVCFPENFSATDDTQL